jgi:hypothetical protein
MPAEDSAIENALDDYNNRLAKSHSRIRLFSGRVMWVGAALSWGLSILAAFLVFKDPAVAADLDGGTRTRNVAWDGRAAAVFALLGLLLLTAGIWRRPSRMRWFGLAILLLGGVPLLWIASFAFLLSQ